MMMIIIIIIIILLIKLRSLHIIFSLHFSHHNHHILYILLFRDLFYFIYIHVMCSFCDINIIYDFDLDTTAL
jgi:hypothetical protein